MDSRQFRRKTYPNFSPIINEDTLRKAAERIEVPSKITAPVDDPRYPGYASMMQDGRIVTDYSSHCAQNVAPSKYGNSLRGWLQHNADALIQVSRKRQSERAGAQYYMANTVIEPNQYQQCDEFECKMIRSSIRDSVGIQRVEGVPHLFGTFSVSNQTAPPPRTPLTTNFEGGRNTPRGREFVPLGLSPRESRYGSSG
jgi:hypothetical protein